MKTLRERIESDIISAQKAADAARLGVLRLLLSEIKNKEIEKHWAGKGDALIDEEIVDVLRREVKKRKDAVTLFIKGGRTDLADKDTADIVVIEAYLPELMSREDIARVVDEVRASGVSDFPSVMREAMKQLKGKADGALVSEIIKSRM